MNVGVSVPYSWSTAAERRSGKGFVCGLKDMLRGLARRCWRRSADLGGGGVLR